MPPHARRRPDVGALHPLKAAAALLGPRHVAGVAREASCAAGHVLTYPMGFIDARPCHDVGYSTRDLSPSARAFLAAGVQAATTPIILMHGLFDNRGVFTSLQRRLRESGFAHVHGLNYSPLTRDVRHAAELLSKAVDEARAASGHDRVHLIGHSLGGLVARYYAQRLDPTAVDVLATLGTPHHGSLVAHLGRGPLIEQLRPGSELFCELDAPAAEVTTRFECYWSDLDHLVLPHASAQLRHRHLSVRHIAVRGVGHMSLPSTPRVANGLLETLRLSGRESTHSHAEPASGCQLGRDDAVATASPPVRTAGAVVAPHRR